MAIVKLDVPHFRGRLELRRTPKYLRFTLRPPFVVGGEPIGASTRWDALDQPDDVPDEEEQIIAAVKVGKSTVHMDRRVNGKRVGEWLEYHVYRPVEPQPSEEILRNYPRWAAWCEQQLAQERANAVPGD